MGGLIVEGSYMGVRRKILLAISSKIKRSSRGPHCQGSEQSIRAKDCGDTKRPMNGIDYHPDR